MSRSSRSRGQTGIETILITGVIIAMVVLLSSYYFGSTSDKTTAIIILKTELLKQFSGMNKAYIISSSLEPVMLVGDTLCFEVKTSPAMGAADQAILNSGSPSIIDSIKSKISGRTRYSSVDIRLEANCE